MAARLMDTHLNADNSIVRATAHEAAAKALIRSKLQYGTKAGIAATMGVSPSYLSRVLSETPHGAYGSPVPVSRRFVEAFIAASGVSTAEAEELRWHVRSAAAALSPRPAATVELFGDRQAEEIAGAHAYASTEGDPLKAGIAYRVLDASLEALLSAPFKSTNPVTAAKTHLIANDVRCIVNRPGDALFHARMASARFEHSTVDVRSLSDNATAAESLALHNMGEDDHARALLLRLYQEDAGEPWRRVALARSVKYAASLPRVPIKELDALVDRFLADYGTPTPDEAEGFLRAYISRKGSSRNLARAELWLARSLAGGADSPEAERVTATVATMGAVKRVIFLRSYATMLGRRGDPSAAQAVLHQARTAAVRGGMTHQLEQIRLQESAIP